MYVLVVKSYHILHDGNLIETEYTLVVFSSSDEHVSYEYIK